MKASTELGANERAVDLTRLGVTELLGNVRAHVPDRRCRLRIGGYGAALYLLVWDGSSDPPAIREPAWDSEGGRGLWLLREMADAIGYLRTAHGKWVWVRCDRAIGAERMEA